MKNTFRCSRLRIILFSVALYAIRTESRHREFIATSTSPTSSYIAPGESLLLNVTLNGAENVSHIEIRWYFRRFLSTSYQRVLYIWLDRSKVLHNFASDARFSAVDQTSLSLINTTLNDSGTYKCEVEGKYHSDRPRYNLSFHVTIAATDQQSSKSFNKGFEWYIVFISFIVGILLGFGLLHVSQWIRRRRANAINQRTQQNSVSVLYADPTTMPSSKQDTYSVPDALPVTSQTPGGYQELNVVRANEENSYQALYLTTIMKKSAQSTGQP